MRKVNFEEKIPVVPLRNSHLLYYPGILQRLQHPIIQFPLYYPLEVAYKRLKTKENFKILALKVIAVAYERWSLTRGFQCSDLAEKTFGIVENWSLRRGGCNQRFDCITLLKCQTSGPGCSKAARLNVNQGLNVN